MEFPKLNIPCSEFLLSSSVTVVTREKPTQKYSMVRTCYHINRRTNVSNVSYTAIVHHFLLDLEQFNEVTMSTLRAFLARDILEYHEPSTKPSAEAVPYLSNPYSVLRLLSLRFPVAGAPSIFPASLKIVGGLK